jgi:hypothetical protein
MIIERRPPGDRIKKETQEQIDADKEADAAIKELFE